MKIEKIKTAPVKIPSSIGKTLAAAIRAVETKCPGLISDISDERRMGHDGSTNDGIWVGLARGFCWAENPGQHTIHEYTETRMVEELKQVIRCSCSACRGDSGEF